VDDATGAASAKVYYDGFGDQYDVVTRTQQYDIWVRLYADLIERHGTSGKTLLDIGCGTGKSAIGLAGLGFTVTGFDFSEEMLKVARAKPGARAVDFVLADARALPDLGTHAVATAMGEPLTHLSTVAELEQCFSGVARSLEPDGLFIFDLPTAGFADRLAKWRIIDDAEDVVILWRGAPRKDGDHAVDVTVDTFTKVDNENWHRATEVLPCYYFSPGQVDHCLRAAGLHPEAVYGLHEGILRDVADQELHRKSLVVARKTF
jgi:ubiquinone/menaquinone biosynthesis C-methylase UbiE